MKSQNWKRSNGRRLSLAAALVFALVVVPAANAEDWKQFRGPNGAGVADSAKLPVKWNTKENVKWAIDLPGPGSSCPIVLGDKVFVTCYTGYGITKENPGNVDELKRHLICYDKNTGKQLWLTTVDSAAEEDPYKGFIVEHGYASSTPVTDGKHVFTFFGKTGACAFDINDGKKVWETSLGTESDPYKWGGGASPILYKDLVIVNAGIEGHKIVALNKSDGKEAWSIENDKFTNCWSTPILVNVDMKTEMVVSMPGKILGIDPASGKELWTCKSPIAQTVCASLVQHDGMVFAMGGRQGRCIAVKCGGKGDVTETNIVWERPVSSSIGTPIVADGKIIWHSRGILTCLNCSDGAELHKARYKAAAAPQPNVRRSPASSYASPLLVGDKVFMLLRSGETYVLNTDEKFSNVSVNALEEDEAMFNATPAISGDNMFIRSQNKLYCISGK